MKKDLRDKLKTISFILVVFVVFSHSNNLAINYSSETVTVKKGLNWFIQNALSEGISKIASPLFFSISGYLFYLYIKDGSITEYLPKYKKRIKTLIIPYLLWSCFGILLFLILQSIPFSKFFFTHELIADLSFTQLLNKFFLIPIPYHLWFIRDLIMLVLISPLLYWSIKTFKYYLLILFLIFWIKEIDFEVFISRALLFFSIGAYFSINRLNMNNLTSKNTFLYFTSWMLLVLIKTYYIYIGYNNLILIDILHKTSIVVGIVSIWLLYDTVYKNRDISQTKIFSLFQFSFFIFAFHEPTLSIIKKGLNFLMGNSEISSFIGFLIAPVIIIFLSILLGYYLKRFIPKFYYLLTGGR